MPKQHTKLKTLHEQELHPYDLTGKLLMVVTFVDKVAEKATKFCEIQDALYYFI